MKLSGACNSGLAPTESLLLAEHFDDDAGSEELASNALVVLGRVVFGPVIGVVEAAGAPVKSELFLALAIA